MRDLQSLADAHDLELAVPAALLQAHEAAKVPDMDAIFELQNKLDVSLVQCAA